MTRLHPLVAPVRMGRSAVQGVTLPFFLFAVGSVVFDVISLRHLFVVVPLGGVLGAAYGLAWYLRFSYELTEDTLDITSGVIARRDREIPYRRIQTVDVTRTVLHRLVGVAVVQIETAGGDSTEAALEFVSMSEADRVRRFVRTRRDRTVDSDRLPVDRLDPFTGTQHTEIDSVDSGSDAADEQTVLFELSTRELLVYSLLTFRSGAVGLVVFSLPLLQGYVPPQVFGAIESLGGATSLATVTPERALVTAGIAVPLVLVAGYVVSAVYSALTYYGFTLAKRGNDLVYECGLFQRYSGSIPRSKVQSLSLTENVPMRQLGYAGLTIETAGYGESSNTGRLSMGSGPPSAIPATRRETALATAGRIEPIEQVDFRRPPRVARRRYLVRYALALGGVLAVAFVVARLVGDFDAWYLPVALAPIVPVAAHLKWRHRGYAVSEAHAAFRTGFWVRQSTIVPYDRLQTMTRSRTVFQRRLGLADFVADTASAVSITGEPATAFDIEDHVAARLHERCRDRLQAQLRE